MPISRPNIILSVLASSLCISSLPLNAAISGLATLGLDAGGDTIQTVYYNNSASDPIKAGELLSIGIGLIFHSSQYPSSETQLTLNWKTDFTTASNGGFSFDRYPLEIIQFYRVKKVRAGAGISYHLNPTLNASGFASGRQTSYDNALGYVFEVDYDITPTIYFGGRVTIIEYQNAKHRYDGNSVGITSGIRF